MSQLVWLFPTVDCCSCSPTTPAICERDKALTDKSSSTSATRYFLTRFTHTHSHTHDMQSAFDLVCCLLLLPFFCSLLILFSSSSLSSSARFLFFFSLLVVFSCVFFFLLPNAECALDNLRFREPYPHLAWQDLKQIYYKITLTVRSCFCFHFSVYQTIHRFGESICEFRFR